MVQFNYHRKLGGLSMRRSSYLNLGTEEWKKARMSVLVRDNFTCKAHEIGLSEHPCEEFSLKKLQVHHIQMRIHGETHDFDNLITLCFDHHAILHPWMKREFPFGETLDYPFKEL
jgi:hypothetical protein